MTNSNGHQYGFRILGPTNGSRRLVVAEAAWSAYLSCDEKSEVHQEAYLSAFTYGEDFRSHMAQTGSTSGFTGSCYGPFIWFDIDREGDINRARVDTARLCVGIIERFKLNDDDLLIFVSGGKGFHVGLPTTLWTPEPSVVFNRVARNFAERVGAATQVATDTGIYDKVRAFRAPNSRHGKTGLHKRRILLDEVMHMRVDAILALAGQPAPVEWEPSHGGNAAAAALWASSVRDVEDMARAKSARSVNANVGLNRLTMSFIRDGATPGSRQTTLYSAAANLREFGAPLPLAHALLTESALDSGLPPSEVRRTIDSAFNSKGTENGN